MAARGRDARQLPAPRPPGHGLRVDPATRQVHWQGTPIELTPGEFVLLELLASEAGRVFTREQLLQHVNGLDEFVSPRTIDVHVANLRKKTAALWTKLNGVQITPDMIRCSGCRVEGEKTPFCDALCPIHNCVRERKLNTCADCAQMDGCKTLGRITDGNPAALENLKGIRIRALNNDTI